MKSPQSFVRVRVSPETVKKLRRPIRGKGGYQSLLAHLKEGLRADRSLLVDREVWSRIRRYAKLSAEQGGGGWQRRLGAIVADARAQKRAEHAQSKARLVRSERRADRSMSRAA